MYGDVHTIGISTAASFIYTEDGRSQEVRVTTVVEDCYMAPVSAREMSQFAQRGIFLNAVVDIPPGVVVPTETGFVDTTCEVTCDDDEVHPYLHGTYRVVEVHPVDDHDRLILWRTQGR